MSFAFILWAAAGAPGVGVGTTPLIIDQNRMDRAPVDRPDDKVNLPRAAVVVSTPTAPIAIRGITFVRGKVPPRVANAAAPYIGRAVNKETLSALAQDLSAAYAKSNVAFYTVSIGAQDFVDGVVRVNIVEGYFSSTAIADPKKRAHPRLRGMVERLIGVQPLSRSYFERQISLMRDLPGLDFDLGATSGADDGAMSLTVTPRQKRTKFTVNYNNRGSQLLGTGQFDASAQLFGALTSGDQFSLTGSAASNFHDFLYAGAGYSIPVGVDGVTVSANAGYLRTRPRSVPIEGSAKTGGVTVSYPLIRGFKRDVLLSAGVDAINSDNAAFGSIIASERTRAVRASASASLRGTKRTIEGFVTVSHGFDAAGARVNPLSAQLGFAKANFAAAVGQQIGKSFVARLRASGQYTRDLLPAAERFAVGGADFGRAFDTSVLTADRGVAGSVELAVLPKIAKKLESTELYVFTDGARVRVLQRGPFAAANYSLASAGIGTRLRYSTKAELGLEGAKSIERPYPAANDDWRVSVSWRLTL